MCCICCAVKNQLFAEIQDVSGLGPAFSIGKFDGIVGMGWNQISVLGIPTVFNNAITQRVCSFAADFSCDVLMTTNIPHDSLLTRLSSLSTWARTTASKPCPLHALCALVVYVSALRVQRWRIVFGRNQPCSLHWPAHLHSNHRSGQLIISLSFV